ncbi:hypothetical protein HGM15179_019270 [Zosterops borbonicus]|uniref:alanine transaminase n=2 Tax=Zosterops borbonicus TaxID=364589 RepID=A0A8K1DBI3_9PASS|nr:hypothetical protein HGM15179_019270 [Zosterops borbonicus]
MAAPEGTAGTAGPPPPVSPFVPPLDCSGDDAQAMGRPPIPVLRQFVLSLFVLPAPALPAGVLVPVPGPALCAAAAGLAGAVPVPYPLEPARGWAPDVAALRRAVRGARGRCRPRVLWVLNPGDPTGHVLSGALMRSLLAVAAEEELLLLADEVHQDLAFSPECPFLPFRRVLAELGEPLATSVQIISCYSLSKGIAGGGARAGFLELVNVDRSVLRDFHTWGLSVYPPILGQVMLDLAMEPPGLGDPAGDAMEEVRRGDSLIPIPTLIPILIPALTH